MPSSLYVGVDRALRFCIAPLSVVLCLFTLVEANYPMLQEQATLAIFTMLGLVLCFVLFPCSQRFKQNPWLRCLDVLLILATVASCGHILLQTQPIFENVFWLGSDSLANRPGEVHGLDLWLGVIGLLVVLEGARRSIGWAVPVLALAFIAYAYFGPSLPDWMLPHQGKDLEKIVETTFLQSQGVFGVASRVMFKYVFLFVVFGAFLEATGGTQFIIDFAERIFGRSPGGPAKVSVLGSGLMGSLSGSAVANAVTTGAFTIPMMRSAGFKPHIAGGITAAAASGGALVPPVMGAGAYMMLDLIEGVTFLDIATAAIIPALLYYFSIFMIVHFYARRTGAQPVVPKEGQQRSLLAMTLQFEGVVFFGALISLIGFLAYGYSPFRAVTLSLAVIVVLGLIHPRKRITLAVTLEALKKSAKNGVSLVAAAACVGIVIGIVDATRVADAFGAEIKAVVQSSLFLALLGVMMCSIVLGMGVPSVVCYLLMATMMGSLLKQLQVPDLAAHLFIFYFGMMSMVTPPVALAAYASASIADANVMRTALAAFRFSLVGFTLPFMFIYRPALLLMGNENQPLTPLSVGIAIGAAVLGIVSLAAGIAGFFRSRLSWPNRLAMLLAAGLLLWPDSPYAGLRLGIIANVTGAGLFLLCAVVNWRLGAASASAAPAELSTIESSVTV